MVTSPISASQDRLDRISRRTRRVLAVATLVGLPAMFAWSAFWTTTSVSNLIWGPITFALIGVTLVGSVVLYRFVKHRADMPGASLDERQRQLRDRAWILSYQVLSAVVIAVVAAVGILVLGFDRPVTLDAGLVNGLVLCVAVLLPVLPVAALAWIEPDPPADV
jgi:uncharacterized membrane protein